jgi:hypothetical protein
MTGQYCGTSLHWDSSIINPKRAYMDSLIATQIAWCHWGSAGPLLQVSGPLTILLVCHRMFACLIIRHPTKLSHWLSHSEFTSGSICGGKSAAHHLQKMSVNRRRTSNGPIAIKNYWHVVRGPLTYMLSWLAYIHFFYLLFQESPIPLNPLIYCKLIINNFLRFATANYKILGLGLGFLGASELTACMRQATRTNNIYTCSVCV